MRYEGTRVATVKASVDKCEEKRRVRQGVQTEGGVRDGGREERKTCAWSWWKMTWTEAVAGSTCDLGRPSTIP